MEFVACDACGGPIPAGWKRHGACKAPRRKQGRKRPWVAPPKLARCRFCGGEARRWYCGKSCAAKDQWRRYPDRPVGRPRRHRPLPPALAFEADRASDELARLIQDQHDDDVPWARSPASSPASWFSIEAGFEREPVDAWSDPTWDAVAG